MTELPSEFEAFASLLDAQPQPAREAFHYCLCLMMVEAGKMRLIDTVPGESGPICTFATAAGEGFSVTKPQLSEAEEAVLIERLRSILDEEWPDRQTITK